METERSEPVLGDLASEFAKSLGMAVEDLARILGRIESIGADGGDLDRLSEKLDALDKKLDNFTKVLGSVFEQLKAREEG
jgi:hypothetical protein